MIRNFILNTDFAMIAQQGNYSVSVTLPSNVVVAGGTVYSRSATVNIPVAKNTQRVMIGSSRNDVVCGGDTLRSARTFSTSSGAQDLSIIVAAVKISATQLQINVMINNPYLDNIIGPSGDETFTAYCSAFYSPV